MEIDNGRYRLIRRVGSGGTGVVYQAADCLLGRTVAVKVLHPSLSARLLEREGQALARIAHSDIVTIYDVIETEGRVFLIMEYVEGRSLHQWLVDHGPMDIAQAIATFRRIAAAVQHAHAHGVLHCDLKPANVLLSTGGEIKLSDFTLARTLESGSFQGLAGGSTAYAAPEQLEGGAIDARTDVFGLGALLLRMVGPVDRSTEEGRCILTIVERATAAEPDDRYPSVESLLADLPPVDESPTLLVARSHASELTRIAPIEPRATRVMRTRIRLPWLLIPCLLATMVAALFMGFHVFAANEMVTVPNLTGVGRVQSSQIAQSLGLRTHVVWSYSSAVPASSVIAQRPRAESKVQKHAMITLVVSQGPKPIPVPSLAGLSRDQAVATLHQMGFRVTVQTAETLFDSVDQVRAQSPDAGTLRIPGSTIVVTVYVHPWWWPLP